MLVSFSSPFGIAARAHPRAQRRTDEPTASHMGDSQGEPICSVLHITCETSSRVSTTALHWTRGPDLWQKLAENLALALAAGTGASFFPRFFLSTSGITEETRRDFESSGEVSSAAGMTPTTSSISMPSQQTKPGVSRRTRSFTHLRSPTRSPSL